MSVFENLKVNLGIDLDVAASIKAFGELDRTGQILFILLMCIPLLLIFLCVWVVMWYLDRRATSKHRASIAQWHQVMQGKGSQNKKF